MSTDKSSNAAVQALLLRAALLSGHGRGAAELASRLARVCRPGAARSCFDVGGPLQLTVDAPGSADLRVGVRLGATLLAADLWGLVSPEQTRHLSAALRALPDAKHSSLGTWLFWSTRRQSLYVDLRDPDPLCALRRLRAVLDRQQLERLEEQRARLVGARPWALTLGADHQGVTSFRVIWLLDRDARVGEVLDRLGVGYWSQVEAGIGRLLRRPGRSGRHAISTSLMPGAKRKAVVATTGWMLVPEDDAKQRDLGRAVADLGGSRDYAEALWSLCQGGVRGRWRVGRTLQVRADEAGLGLRLFLTPQVQSPAADSHIELQGCVDGQVGSAPLGEPEPM